MPDIPIRRRTDPLISIPDAPRRVRMDDVSGVLAEGLSIPESWHQPEPVLEDARPAATLESARGLRKAAGALADTLDGGRGSSAAAVAVRAQTLALLALYDLLDATLTQRSEATFDGTPALLAGVTASLAALPINPDCRDGKHHACSGEAWDDHRDAPTVCACCAAGHPKETPAP